MPIGRYLEKKSIGFIAKQVDEIDAANNTLKLQDGETVNYDYLVITTGARLAFDEVEGTGPDGGFPVGLHSRPRGKILCRFQKLLEDPGPVVVGAAPFASCFGPAYEYAAILDIALKKHKVRDKVPMTFVTSEPISGHLGLGGVGDSKGMLEHEFRNRHINWITNAGPPGLKMARCTWMS
ncbi:MAG: FAD/NAD(P)-binding oxidoreductase [Thiohalophilus sp.]|nr:FAD/NAD(P)-binding oxidoreductase [Thiohalophilus sp.]MDZ7803248.1 FAD/NAD(P)-binding oxidoreductase [Thiohalophilus sp.]